MTQIFKKFVTPAIGLVALCTLMSAPGSAADLEKVTLRLAYIAGGIDAPIFVAAGKGYFADEGLDVDIVDGNGSTGTIQAIGNGSFNIGIAGLGALAQASATSGLDTITAVAGLVQKDPSSIISLKGSGINKPQDIAGKRFATDAGNLADGMIKAFAEANGVDMDSIKLTITNADQTALLKGDADFVNEWANPDGDHIKRFAEIEPPMLFADYGVNILGSSVIVRKDYLAAHEKEIRGFLKAIVKAHDDVVAKPADALALFMKYRPDADPKSIAEEIEVMEKYRHTARTEGKPLGAVDADDLKQTISLLEKYSGMPVGVVKPEAVYTDAYLPAK
ncbi:ABC transporter substrate-binding protein [Rhizobium sp. 18055]|jgi:NitT/TauT family transport system substrate-binding protein|uniref:ABC transporter substrate-binding protein n=1 Tax=Rhizobium sp. 18055 TaxID=2681403 RepID=UPI0013575BA9|nr:ABC transporter substrate-binding protein [Rhizobium sp. 18055]